MQFPCARCGRTYEIADELVVGRAVKVACPGCGNLAVHRVPAPSAAAAPAPPPQAPPPLDGAHALADADDLDFDAALDALEGPGGGSPTESAAPGLPGPPPASAQPVPAARPPRPAARAAPPPPAPSLEEEEPVMVTAELVLRRSTRRARLTAAAVAIVAVGAVVGGGAFALRMKRPTAVRERKEAAAGEGSAGAGALSAADLAKLMGKKAPEPEAPPPPAAAPRPAADRPKHEKLAAKDKGLLDLLSKKGDAAVTVQAEDAAALSTSRGTLDERAIEATLTRNSGSISACVNRALQADPESRLNGKRVSLELTIRPSGRVEKAAMADKEIARTPLGQCIAQAAKRMVFPGFDGEAIDIVVPIKLQVTF